jgi:hypothetical protein
MRKHIQSKLENTLASLRKDQRYRGLRRGQCVRQMLYKLSSEKTKGPWLRRLFRYQEWLSGKVISEDYLTDLLLW